MEVTEVGKELKTIRAHISELTTQLEKAKATRETLEQKMIEAMLEEGVNALNIQGVGRFSLVTKAYLSVNSANKPEFFKYLQESGNGDLLKLDVNPMTLKAFLREHLDLMTQKTMQTENKDEIESRNEALEYLKRRGASFFTDRSIRFGAE